MPRRYLHWDREAIVLFGGVPAQRGEPPRGCVRGLRSIVLGWDEVLAARLVDPFPSVEICYRFEGVVQAEVVRPGHAMMIESFAALAYDFVEALHERAPDRVDQGWDRLLPVPFEPAAALPNDPFVPAEGSYRSAPRPEPLVAYRYPDTTGERWRASLWRGESLRSREGGFDLLLGRQGFPWSVRGTEVLLTYEHAYVPGPRGGARVALEALRERVDLPHERLYVFGRRTVLAFAERSRCDVQDVLDGRIKATRTPVAKVGT